MATDDPTGQVTDYDPFAPATLEDPHPSHQWLLAATSITDMVIDVKKICQGACKPGSVARTVSQKRPYPHWQPFL